MTNYYYTAQLSDGHWVEEWVYAPQPEWRTK